jgi:hypothetical protein
MNQLISLEEFEGFKNQKKRDRRKAALCAKNGGRLFIVCYDEDMDVAVSRITTIKV